MSGPASSPTTQPPSNPLILPALAQLPDTTLNGVAVKVRNPASLRRALRRGLPVRLICGEPCVATLRLWLAPRVANQLGLTSSVVVGRSRARLSAPGSIRVRVRFYRTAHATFAARRAVRIALRATIKDVAGNRRQFSRPVTLRR
jgi:hypothetical protein